MNNFTLKEFCDSLQKYFESANKQKAARTQNTAEATENHTEFCLSILFSIKDWVVWKLSSQQHPDFFVISREIWNRIINSDYYKKEITSKSEKKREQKMLEDDKYKNRVESAMNIKIQNWPADVLPNGKYRKQFVTFVMITKGVIEKWIIEHNLNEKIIKFSVKASSSNYRPNRNPPRKDDYTIFINFDTTGKKVYVAIADDIIKHTAEPSRQEEYLDWYEKARRAFVLESRKRGKGLDIVAGDSQPNMTATAECMNINSSIEDIADIFCKAIPVSNGQKEQSIDDFIFELN